MDMIPFIAVDRYSATYDDDNAWFDSEPHQYVHIDDSHKTTSSSEIRRSMKNFEKENIGFSKSFFNMCDANVFAYMLNHELYMKLFDPHFLIVLLFYNHYYGHSFHILYLHYYL